ncbi:MAG: glutaredoxin, partial [Thermoproteota archaeon]
HAADLKGELWAVFGGSAGLPYFFINDNGGGCRQIGDMQPEELTEGL